MGCLLTVKAINLQSEYAYECFRRHKPNADVS